MKNLLLLSLLCALPLAAFANNTSSSTQKWRTVRWDDLSFPKDSSWMIEDRRNSETYYSLAHIARIERDKSLILIHFSDDRLSLRINLGKVNAKKKLKKLLYLVEQQHGIKKVDCDCDCGDKK